MNRKAYISPDMEVYSYIMQDMLMGSVLNKDADNQVITPTSEEYNDEFQGRWHDIWEDEE